MVLKKKKKSLGHAEPRRSNVFCSDAVCSSASSASRCHLADVHITAIYQVHPGSAGFIYLFFSHCPEMPIVRCLNCMKGVFHRKVRIICGTCSSSVASSKVWRVTEWLTFSKNGAPAWEMSPFRSCAALKPAQSDGVFKIYRCSGLKRPNLCNSKLNCEVLGKHLPWYTAAWLF